jgi:two-component sensor histidine kinase
LDQHTDTGNIEFPEYKFIDEYREKMRYKMAIQISIFFILIFTTLTIVFINEGTGQIMGYLAALGISSAMLIQMAITKSVKYTLNIYGFAGSMVAQASCFFILYTSHYVDFIWIIVCIFVVYLGGNRKMGHFVLILNTIGIGYFIFFRHNLHISAMQESNTLQLSGVYLEILLSLFVLAYLMYQFMHFQDFTDKEIKKVNASLYRQNQVIDKQNTENVTLLKEIHHRVKNNLQIIVSLLRLQKNELKLAESREQFQEAINRVLVMSSIHQKLYQQENLINVNLGQYLEELIDELKLLFQNHKQIDVTVTCEFPNMGLKTMVPVGLIINELVSNSLKYAFTNLENGSIEIDIAYAEQGFNLKYSDNGEWLEEEGEHGFGLELVEVFTSQLNGERTFVINEQGSNYLFELEFAD